MPSDPPGVSGGAKSVRGGGAGVLLPLQLRLEVNSPKGALARSLGGGVELC